MKTLLINAHPGFKHPHHFSIQLQTQFITKFNQIFPTSDLTILNLYDITLPRIEEQQLYTIWAKQDSNEPLLPEEAKLATISDQLLAQLKAHHRIVIATPVHNFNVTSRLKDWLDNILIARETYRYLAAPLANGRSSEGLLTDDYRVLVLIASGSIYTRHDYYEQLDFAPNYLRLMFTDLMGFSQFDLVRAQGTDIRPNHEVVADMTADLDAAFTHFYQE